LGMGQFAWSRVEQGVRPTPDPALKPSHGCPPRFWLRRNRGPMACDRFYKERIECWSRPRPTELRLETNSAIANCHLQRRLLQPCRSPLVWWLARAGAAAATEGRKTGRAGCVQRNGNRLRAVVREDDNTGRNPGCRRCHNGGKGDCLATVGRIRRRANRGGRRSRVDVLRNCAGGAECEIPVTLINRVNPMGTGHSGWS
jgi:hypothetical protein